MAILLQQVANVFLGDSSLSVKDRAESQQAARSTEFSLDLGWIRLLVLKFITGRRTHQSPVEREKTS